ncbi:MAG: methyltransferase domain-containing protein [Campylobacterota bacterium]|nr:methyltransferase domain-containing protein [Campylobacterota bacterium]
MNLKNKNLLEIIDFFENLDKDSNNNLSIYVTPLDIDKIGYKSWIDISALYYFKFLTPFIKDNNTIILNFQKLNQTNSFHIDKKNTTEKYGVNSEFFNVDKSSQTSFLYYYIKTLEFINIKDKKQILNIGVNKGDEFQIIKDILENEEFKNKLLMGIDYSKTAINYAKDLLPYENVSFLCEDINNIDNLNLPKSDLIISIGTLQSVNIDFKKTFMKLYQNYLTKDGAIILGFPNCRWIDKEMIYGAKVPHYNFSEMSTVIKDIYFCKKYLQQKNFRVAITGKDYIFLTARKIVR